MALLQCSMQTTHGIISPSYLQSLYNSIAAGTLVAEHRAGGGWWLVATPSLCVKLHPLLWSSLVLLMLLMLLSPASSSCYSPVVTVVTIPCLLLLLLP